VFELVGLVSRNERGDVDISTQRRYLVTCRPAPTPDPLEL
jgi:hypothetical protein